MEAKDMILTQKDILKLVGNLDAIEMASCQTVAQAQAEISFKAGIREGVRRVYEDVKAHHYIIDYDLEVALKALEKYKDK